jgi:hypothetical protein
MRRSEKATGAPDPKAGAGLAARLSVFAHLSQVLSPSSQVGPEPVYIPATGHCVVIEVIARTPGMVLGGFRAEVTDRRPLLGTGTSITLDRMPDLVSADDLQQAARRSAESFVPLEIPQFEIFLDPVPPVIRPALDGDGSPVRPTPVLPARLREGEYAKFVFAPVTADDGLVRWAISLDWNVPGQSAKPVRWNLAVTGKTGFKTFSSDGSGAVPTSVREVGTDHWMPLFRQP